VLRQISHRDPALGSRLLDDRIWCSGMWSSPSCDFGFLCGRLHSQFRRASFRRRPIGPSSGHQNSRSPIFRLASRLIFRSLGLEVFVFFSLSSKQFRASDRAFTYPEQFSFFRSSPPDTSAGVERESSFPCPDSPLPLRPPVLSSSQGVCGL